MWFEEESLGEKSIRIMDWVLAGRDVGCASSAGPKQASPGRDLNGKPVQRLQLRDSKGRRSESV